MPDGMRSLQVQAGQTVCTAIDRSRDRVYTITYSIDKIPTLTTRNFHLFLFSTEDLHLPCRHRRLFRYLSPDERLDLQGVDQDGRENLTDAMKVLAAGNSFSSPVIAAMVLPMVKQIGHLPATWPPSEVVIPAVCKAASHFELKRGTRKRRRNL